MSEFDLYEEGSDEGPPDGDRIIHTQVVDSYDEEGLARVTVQIPWLDDPVVASVATGAAGKGRGMFFIPQKGDEVLVLVKDQPDLTAYVIGSVWTSEEEPPRREPDAAANIQLIRTPGGHEIVFNDETGELIITAISGHKVTLSKNNVEIRSVRDKEDKEAAASITLKANGEISVKGSSITLEAETGALTLSGTSVELKATAGDCVIKGTPNVNIN
jgi:type VI secretion system secreted protein VgrG